MTLSGHTSQFSIYATIVALSIISSVAVALRLITRLAVVKQSGWDDVFITIAWILSIAMGATIWKQANYGMGLHITTVSEADIHTAFRWFWVFLWLYYASLCFTKLSILLQYIRIFKTKRFLLACYGMIAIVFCWSCWAVFSSIFTCTPVERFWKQLGWAVDGCLPRLTLWYTNAGINIGTDLATAMLPLPVIHTLDIPKRQKMILMGVFAAGIFTCLISILRLVYIYPLTVSPDFTWNSPLPTIWSCVETNTAIVCSCVPTFKGLVQRYFPKLLASMNNNRFKGTAVSSSTNDSTLKSKDSEKSASPLWRVGEKLSLSNFGGFSAEKNVAAHHDCQISDDDEERFVSELTSIPESSPHL